MTWWIAGGITAVVFAALVAMAVLAERRPDPAPDRQWSPDELPGVRTDQQVYAEHAARLHIRDQRRTWRPDRGDH